MLRRTFLATLAAVGLPGLASGAAQPAPPKPSAKAGATLQITISGIAFAEVKQPLTVGDTIEWINKDVVAHTATAREQRLACGDSGKRKSHPCSEEARARWTTSASTTRT